MDHENHRRRELARALQRLEIRQRKIDLRYQAAKDERKGLLKQIEDLRHELETIEQGQLVLAG